MTAVRRRSLRRDLSVLCLASAYVAAKLAGYDLGFAAGLYAGATTISASIGLATDAINRAGIDERGTGAQSHPGRLRRDLPLRNDRHRHDPRLPRPDAAPHQPRRGMQAIREGAFRGRAGGRYGVGLAPLDLRAFKVKPDGQAVGKTVAQAEALHPEIRVFIERIRRDGKIIDFDANTVLKAGDIVAVSGPTESLVTVITPHAEEVADRDLEDVPVESVDVFVQKKAVNGKTLLELAKTGLRERRLPDQDHPGCDFGRDPDTGPNQDLPRRHSEDFGHQGSHGSTRRCARIRRSAGDRDRRGVVGLGIVLGGFVRRPGAAGRRGSDHALHVGRRTDRRPYLRVAAVRPSDLRPRSGTGALDHELRRPQCLHRGGGHLGGSRIRRWLAAGRHRPVLLGCRS